MDSLTVTCRSVSIPTLLATLTSPYIRLIFQTPDVSEDSNNNKFSSHLPIGPRHGALARSPPKHSLPPRATLPPSLHDPLISSPSSCRPSLGVRTTLTFQAPSSVPPPKGDTLAPAPRHLPRAQSAAPKWLPRRPRLRRPRKWTPAPRRPPPPPVPAVPRRPGSAPSPSRSRSAPSPTCARRTCQPCSAAAGTSTTAPSSTGSSATRPSACIPPASPTATTRQR